MVLKFGQRARGGGGRGGEGVMKKLLRNKGLVERRASKFLYQFFFRKECFHYYWNTFSSFLSAKYFCLLQSIDLFFHAVYFLLENDIS